ncbi:MAG TPA: hypothetical protein VNF75_08285 [Candidatus Dormibacteraeota bacterium]|nr:hypothetical protein [Candidatus Dormibacteraeota bacterium]
MGFSVSTGGDPLATESLVESMFRQLWLVADTPDPDGVRLKTWLLLSAHSAQAAHQPSSLPLGLELVCWRRVGRA